MKLLLVDDSKAARMLIRSLISDYDSSFEIIEAGNGKEAVELFKKETPAITFLDLTMPVMDGFEALKQIKEYAPQSPVFVLTADIQEKSVEKCLALGANKVLHKLPDKKIISEVLDEILGTGR